MWTEKVRCVGVYIVSSKALRCTYCDLKSRDRNVCLSCIQCGLWKDRKTSVGRCCHIVVVELLKTINVHAYIIIWFRCLSSYLSSEILNRVNRVIISCGRKNFIVNIFKIVAEYMKMFGVSDVAEAVVTRK